MGPKEAIKMRRVEYEKNIQFIKADGTAAAAAPAANPETGDSGVMLYILLAAGSAALLFAVRKSFIKQPQ